MQRDYQAASRLRLKRSLLDKLAQNYDFAVPPGMVELEFENIWRQHEAQKERTAQQEGAAAEPVSAAGGEPGQEAAPPEAPDTATSEQFADAASPEPAEAEGGVSAADQEANKKEGVDTEEDDEASKVEYRRIAERRVRLGLLLAEVGRSNNITVTQDELNQAITREARRHPGYERQVLDFYRQNPNAVANLRAPIFEDKVVDFIVELAKVQERKISPQELLTLPDPDDAGVPNADEPDASGAVAD
jgi:trigger factor